MSGVLETFHLFVSLHVPAPKLLNGIWYLGLHQKVSDEFGWYWSSIFCALLEVQNRLY